MAAHAEAPKFADPESLRLWSGEAPLAKGAEEGDVPTLRLYRVERTDPVPAVVIYPGGGYGGLAIGHEGEAIARWFNRMGITAGICIYRHRNSKGPGEGYGHPVPMLDAQRAIRMMRANANGWGINAGKIGVIGFSAGGHLASTVSTRSDGGSPDHDDPIERFSCRPDYAILGYPVIGFGKPYGHAGSQRNLLGPDANPELVESLSNESAVNDQTPPTFLFHTAEDQVVKVENSVQYFSSLVRSGVPAELHVFEKGRHGVGLAEGLAGTDQWPALCQHWLKARGIID